MCLTVLPMPALVLAMATLMMSMGIGDVREFHSLPRWSGSNKGEHEANEVCTTIRARQYPRPDTSKSRRSKKAKIDSRDDDDLCS